MTKRKHNILFLGTGSNNLHVMADAISERFAGDTIEVVSASVTPAASNPLTVQAMAEIGLDISNNPLRTPLDIEVFLVDLVITLGDFDQSCRPSLPGAPPHIHWNITEPADVHKGAGRLEEFRKAREQILDRLHVLFESGMLSALFTMRSNLELVLDNLIDGVMAHTTNRRIFYFNQAAEQITGYHREDILGRDCHDVFQSRFCGGTCDFCDGAKVRGKGQHVERSKEVVFQRPNGEQRLLEMSTTSLTSLTNEEGVNVGALISFKDCTELASLKQRLHHHHALGGLVGKDPIMLALFDLIREVSRSDVSVLLQGESGAGKELVANAIHDLGARADKPFVAINCGALPEGLLESELFGHVRGAFTGAVRDKKGRFELAHGGTIFLDEVAELSPAMQVKLLRVLQERIVEPVGGERQIPVDIRVISATHQNLRKIMEKGKFRKDLFYRLCVIPIETPPLRERRLDIPMLAEHFVEFVSRESGRPLLIPSVETIDILTRYHWPGNVRELRNAIEFAYVKCHGDTILPEHLPPEIRTFEKKTAATPGPRPKLTREQIIVALARSDGNKRKAAEYLGVGRATLYRYLSAFNLS